MKKNTKSPLTAKPLRHPGQSIDEKIDELIDNEVSKYAIFSIFLIVIAATEWFRWYLDNPYNPKLYTIIALSVTAFSTYKIVKIKKQITNLKLGRDGERAVGQFLESLRENGCKVYHDIIGNNFNIDHVIISKNGIFTIETKTYSKPLYGKATVKYDGKNITLNGKPPIQDFLTQARAGANWLSNLLQETSGKKVQVKPVVVFPGWFVDSKQAGFNPNVWVLNPKVLSEFISKSQMSLTNEDISLFSHNISRYIRSNYPS